MTTTTSRRSAECASASDLLQHSLAGTDDRRDVIAVLSALTREELHATLIELLDLVDAFVLRLAEHNAISERAVLRSMGIEPNARALGSDRPRTPRVTTH